MRRVVANPMVKQHQQYQQVGILPLNPGESGFFGVFGYTYCIGSSALNRGEAHL